jgi:ribosomal protein S18 acetylase RimI-like enzyme
MGQSAKKIQPKVSFRLIEATLEHVKSLSLLAQQTFAETYEHYASSESMKNYVTKVFSEKIIDTLIKNKKNKITICLVGEELAGYSVLILDEPCPHIPKKSRTVKFDKNYVLKKFHGLGIGKALYQVRLDFAKASHYEKGWLRVSHTNHEAISYHQKNGFVMIGEKIEDLIQFVPKPYRDFDYFMVKNL